MAEISKITLPSGNTYDIKDAVARQMISGGVSFLIAWDGNSTPVVSQIPAGVSVYYNNVMYTGTLSTADAQAGAFYLVKSETIQDDNANVTGDLDIYDEYVVVGPSGDKKWEKIGDTQVDISDLGALAYKSTVTLSKGSGDQVLGEATTFTNGTSSVTFSGGTTDKALGVDTTFTVTQPTISVTPTTTNIKATASGTAVGANGTAAAITGFGAHTTGSALGSSATFTTSVTPTTTNIKATASGTAVGADGTATFVKSYPGATSKLVTTTVPNVTSAGSASTWSFSLGTGTDSETLIISGGNGAAPTLGTAKTVATGGLDANGGGSSVMTGLGTPTTASGLTGVKVTAQPTVALATGATAGTGVISVATGITSASTSVDSADTVSAITALGTPTTSTCLTGVKVTTQPTISLATGATAGTGVISVATGISSASASGAAVTVGTNDQVTAVTSVGTGTAAAQTITVGTNDKVKVAKYDDLSVSAS